MKRTPAPCPGSRGGGGSAPAACTCRPDPDPAPTAPTAPTAPDGTDGTDGKSQVTRPAPTDSSPEAPRVTPKGYVLNRWVAWTEDGNCDSLAKSVGSDLQRSIGAGLRAAETWTGRPLFALDDTDRWSGNLDNEDAARAGIPDPLRGYCLVEGPVPADLEEAAIRHTEAVARDRSNLTQVDLRGSAVADRAVVTRSALDEAVVSGAFAQDYLAAVGRTDWASCPAATRGDTADGAQLVFLDNMPTGANPGEIPAGSDPATYLDGLVSQHGFALAAASRRILCSDPFDAATCGVGLRSRIALPFKWQGDNLVLSRDGRGRLSHGEVGTRAWLAQAIRREVIRWQRDDPRSRLVLNLSLAWSPELDGSPLGQSWTGNRIDRLLYPDTAAVYDALRDAQCRGAIVVTASGNRMGNPNERGPLLPAAWAHPPLSDAAACSAYLGGNADERHTQPLLYAVGGVDADAKALAVGLPDSAPALVAYGHNITTAISPVGVSPVVYTRAQTGTSASAMVVASQAAATWARSPDTDPAALMAQVHRDAPTAAAEAKVSPYFAGAWLDDSQVVGACVNADNRCCIEAAPSGLDLENVALGKPEGAPVAPAVDALELPPPTDDALVHPQPRDNGCSYCFLDVGDSLVYLDLERDWDDGKLMVTVEGSDALTGYPLGPLKQGSTVTALTDLSASSSAATLYMSRTNAQGVTFNSTAPITIKP